MRILIVRANIITGDGETILQNRSIVIENGLIESIQNVPCPIDDHASYIVDAAGGFVIPGLINRHAHNVTMGPVGCDYAEPALPKARVIQNLNQHLLEGETTIVNQDGFVSTKELEEARSLTPMLLQTFSLQMPIHFKKAKVFSLGGLKEEHYKITIEDMVRKGALGIGEVGAFGISRPLEGDNPDISYIDVEYVPLLVRSETGHAISTEEASALRSILFADSYDDNKLTKLMLELNIIKAKEKLLQLKENIIENAWLNIKASDEAVTYAKKLKIPLDFHSAPQTWRQVIEFSQELGELFQAAHSNVFYKPDKAIEVAREVKKAGGWIDICTGNYFRSRQFFKNHATTMALVSEGLVDIISTDNSGGYWDSILRVLEYLIDQNVIDLPRAISMATKNVVKAIPNVAPNRGEIKGGKVADLVVLDQKHISQVKTVLIGGKVVVDNGRIIQDFNEN